MFVTRRAWEAVDGFDERWFMYAEDTDLCLRIGDAGFSVDIVRDARAVHSIGQSSSVASSAPRQLDHAWIVNTFDLYMRRHRPSLAAKWCWRTVVELGLFTRAAGYRRRARTDARQTIGQVTDWAAESEKFLSHARALREVPLRAHRSGNPAPSEWLRYASLKGERLLLAIVNRWRRRSLLGNIEVAVSLTTHGARLSAAANAIESIGRGTSRPSRIILWLDEERELPRSIRRLQARGLEVLQSGNFGPHTKYYPYVATEFHKWPNHAMVVVDDDSMMRKRWLAELAEVARNHPNEVVCHRAWRMTVYEDKLAPYLDWEPCTSDAASFRNFATGVGGVLYPPALLRHIREEGQEFLSKAPKADDVWLNAIAVRTGFATRQVRNSPSRIRTIPGTETGSLAIQNVEGLQNDVQIAMTYTHREIQTILNDAYHPGVRR